MKHQHRGIAHVSGGAIFKLALVAWIDRRRNSRTGKSGQVLREELGVER
jgi:hypothetical protein